MPGQTVIVDPEHGAGISSWDLRASRMALASVLRRRPEAYHADLIAFELAARDGDKDGAAPTLRRLSMRWSWSRNRAWRPASTMTVTNAAAG